MFKSNDQKLFPNICYKYWLLTRERSPAPSEIFQAASKVETTLKQRQSMLWNRRRKRVEIKLKQNRR